MNIPNGYRVVPVDLDDEMLAAYERASIAPIGPISRHGYEVMLDAAPTQPQPIYDESKERELFEAWYCSLEENCMPLHRPDGGRYKWDVPEHQWQSWLACAQSRAKSVEVGDE